MAAFMAKRFVCSAMAEIAWLASCSMADWFSMLRICSSTACCLTIPLWVFSSRDLKDAAIFSTDWLTELMFPIISSTAAEAWVTPDDWPSIIRSRDSMLDAIWFTAAAVWSTLLVWFPIWPRMLCMLAMIWVIEAAVSCALSCIETPAPPRFLLESFICAIISCSFSMNLLNSTTTSETSSFPRFLMRLVRSASPEATSSIAAFTVLSGFRLIDIAAPTAQKATAIIIIERM